MTSRAGWPPSASGWPSTRCGGGGAGGSCGSTRRKVLGPGDRPGPLERHLQPRSRHPGRPPSHGPGRLHAGRGRGGARRRPGHGRELALAGAGPAAAPDRELRRWTIGSNSDCGSGWRRSMPRCPTGRPGIGRRTAPGGRTCDGFAKPRRRARPDRWASWLQCRRCSSWPWWPPSWCSARWRARRPPHRRERSRVAPPLSPGRSRRIRPPPASWPARTGSPPRSTGSQSIRCSTNRPGRLAATASCWLPSPAST